MGRSSGALGGPKAATEGGVSRPHRSLPEPKGPPEPRSAAGEGPGPSRAPRSARPGPPDSPARCGRAPFVPTGRGGGDGACALHSALSTRRPRPAADSLIHHGGLFGCSAHHRGARNVPAASGTAATPEAVANLRDATRAPREGRPHPPLAARRRCLGGGAGRHRGSRGAPDPQCPETRSSLSPAPGTPVTVPRVVAAGGESAGKNGRARRPCGCLLPTEL